MKKVNILMSTYNGEKYLEEQLQSLFAQSYKNIEIHVRDDGSTDGTKEILKKYADQEKIILYEGENLGYKKSFDWLLKNCNDADYFAYCDQDDIWMQNKIENAVIGLKEYDNIPAIYISNFYWCDENCKAIRSRDAYKYTHYLEKFITRGDINSFGFAEVFNKNALEGIKNKSCIVYNAHDEVVYQYCLCNGKVIWGEEPEVYYRRHGGNASFHEYAGGNHFTHFVWKVKTFLLTNNKDDVYYRVNEFYQAFKQELSNENREIYEKYISHKHQISKACWKHRYRDKLWDEFCIRIMFLIGRM